MRITALEKEVARFKAQIEAEPPKAPAECSTEELLSKIEVLEKVGRRDDGLIP